MGEKEDWIARLERDHSTSRVFRYYQQKELKKALKTYWSDGVCYGMSVDWVRRKLFNDFRLDTQQAKRDFNHPRYSKIGKRSHLSLKHGKLQDAYRQGPRDDRKDILGRMAAVLPGKGLEKLNYRDDHETVYLEPWCSTAAFEKVLGKIPSKTGMIGSFHKDAVFHAIAVHRNAFNIQVFDPNFGEYAFQAVEHAAKFLYDLSQGYQRFQEARLITFGKVTWDHPEAEEQPMLLI